MCTFYALLAPGAGNRDREGALDHILSRSIIRVNEFFVGFAFDESYVHRINISRFIPLQYFIHKEIS